MKKLDDYQKYLPILSKAKLFEGIPLEHYPQIFNFLQASILSFEKDELIQHLGEPLLYSGIVLDGTVTHERRQRQRKSGTDPHGSDENE